MKFPFRPCIVVMMSGLFVVSCGSGDNGPIIVDPADPKQEVKAGPDQLKLRQFSSCDVYREFISDSITNSLLAPFVYDWLFPVLPGALPPTPGSAGQDAIPDLVSTTNLIEDGVDEADLVKTDAEGNLFVASGRFLVIADGFPPTSMNTVIELELAEVGTAQRLFIDRATGRAMVVVAGTPDPLAETEDPVPSPLYGTTLVFIDITDMASPAITGRLWLDNTSSERLIEGRLHLLSQEFVSYPNAVYTDTEIQALQTAYYQAVVDNNDSAIARIRVDVRMRVASIVAAIPIEQFLPHARIAGAANEFSELAIATCASLVSPAINVRLGLSTVLSLDLDGTDIGALTALTTTYGTPYVSANHYYLQQTSDNWWLDTDQAEQTAIHKIAIGAGAPEYRGMGLVDGVADTPFQFSEHEGYLRVFTEELRLLTGGVWIPRQTNHLFVLEDDGAGTLAITGSVLDIVQDEAIFAARFLGDRGFLVTFQQIDPLFAFDLSDPHAPTLMGEIEIPGFSNYIHPLGDNHLLTIGRSGPNQPADREIQLQIFDVSDLRQPMLIHAYIPQFGGAETGWVWSPAEYDHKAFTYFEPNGILTIPVIQYGSNPESQFGGFVVLRVDIQNGFEELGRIDHADLAYQAYCQSLIDTGMPLPDYCTNPDYRLIARPARSVIMTEGETAYIYSLSNVGVKATPALDADDVLGSILLPVPEPEYWVVN